MVGAFIISTLSMLITLAIAYGIDQFIVFQQRIARQELTFQIAQTWVVIGGLVILVVWLALGWLNLVKFRRIRAVSIIYIVVGLLSFLWFPLELVSRFWMIHFYLFPNLVYNLQYSGLYIATLGFLTLLIPRINHGYLE